MGNSQNDSMKNLSDKTAKLEKQVESVSSKQIRTDQDVTRNTGRLNQVERDMKNVATVVENVQKEQIQTRKVSETEIANINKLTGKTLRDIKIVRESVIIMGLKLGKNGWLNNKQLPG